MKKLSSPANNILYPDHGGNHRAAVKELEMPDGPVIDFSASVNPLGPSPKVSLMLSNMASLLAEYPDPSSMQLGEKVSEYLKIPLGQILVTNGSTELIHLLPRLLKPGKEVLILNPCFSEYERVLGLDRISVHSMVYQADRSFQMDPEEVAEYLHQHSSIGMLVLGHPNNPTGHSWAKDSLDALIHYCKSTKIILVVDETFIEFCPDAVSALKWMENNPYLVVIRSMTKFFGLAGVRLGYGVMHPDLRTLLREYQIPWSVNALAQVLGVVALEDRDFVQQTRKIVREQRLYLYSELKNIGYVRVFPSQANFLLFRLSSGNTKLAHQLYMSLIMDGVLVRNCGNFVGLDESYFRVAIRTKKENQMLVSRIEAHLGKEC